MGKIKVEVLARSMGLQTQDLIFKLRSIGVRVEGEDALVDSEILQAVLQGKKLAAPREVIVRDEESQKAEPRPTRRLPPSRRRPGPLRPTRPRTMIQRVEPKIKTIPVRDRPRAAPSPAIKEQHDRRKREAEEAAQAAAEAEVTAQQEAAEATEEAAEEAVAEEGEAEEEERHRKPARHREVEAEEEAEEPAARPKKVRRKREKVEIEGGEVVELMRPRPEGPVTVVEGMTVRDFADKLGIKSKDLIKHLFSKGIVANINQVLDSEMARNVAEELGFETMEVSFEEEVQLRHELEQPEESGEKQPRAPVVTIMGHVDHGKTTLLDAIRESRIVEGEHGGITQHIGAYQVETRDGRKLVFLDTPGHEAFTQLRARGAQVTDLVVLVVAADDGVMPQTKEAIDHARAADVPIVVAVNKTDKANANPDRVLKELSDHGLVPEDWGGDTVTVKISALQGEGIDNLLEMIGLTADILELEASSDIPAQAVVIEARKDTGRGTVATILVQEGTLGLGDSFVCGATWGRVRSMTNDLGERVKEVGPATPVEVTGFQDVPAAGDSLQVVEEESKARSIAEYRRSERRKQSLASAPTKISLEQLFSSMEEGVVKELPVVVKADVQGSVEVLRETLAKQSTERVKVNVIHAGVGAISSNDVLLASASGAIVIGFNVRPERNATELADEEGVDIRLHTVIYELTDELKKAMVGLLEPVFREVSKGRAEVRDTFRIPKVGTVAGCHVVEGAIPRSAQARLLRDNVVIYDGRIASLRRFKDDVSEVRTGFDCGIGLERFQDVKPGDVIEAYVKEEVEPTL